MKHKKLGELLQERGKISAPDLAKSFLNSKAR
jgi:hypothetical protein